MKTVPAHTTSGSPTARTGFTIAVGCPGCGGELELQDDFFVLRCSHCTSALRITMPEQPPAYLVKGRKAQHEVRFAVDRHLKEHGEALTSLDLMFKRIYYPYWKVDAVLLKTRNKIDIVEQVNEDGTKSSLEPDREIRRTEVTLAPYAVTFPAANRMEGMPHSIGLRATYIKAEPFAEEKMQDGYRPLPVVVNWAEARDLTRKTVDNVGNIESPEFGKNRTEMFRPRGSIVYFPYWVVESYHGGGFRRWVVDGVTGKVAGSVERIEASDCDDDEHIEFGQLRIGLHRCGNCGHDLPAEQSYVYVCVHCGQVTRVEEHPLFGGNVLVTDGAKARAGDVLLPFWSMEMSADLAGKLKVLAGGVGKAGRLVVPAFRVTNFEGVYRLGRRMTTAQAAFTLREAAESDRGFAPVGVGPSEALVLARVMVARELVGQTATLAVPPAADAFTGMTLFYVPFHAEQYFYVDSVVNAVAVEKNLVPQY